MTKIQINARINPATAAAIHKRIGQRATNEARNVTITEVVEEALDEWANQPESRNTDD